MPVEGLAVAIVGATEGSPVEVQGLIADGREGLLVGLVESAAGAQAQLGRNYGQGRTYGSLGLRPSTLRSGSRPTP